MSTVQSQTLPTSDLRSFAKEARRDVEHKVKWARGGRSAPGKRCPHGFEAECTCSERPIGPQNRPGRRVERLTTKKGSVRRGLNTDDLYAPPSDSSADEEVHDASAAPKPLPDAEVMYSFDASHGPAKGSQILSLAITKAVERFENQETEKLAKEYEFVDGKENEADGEYFADEDDFEFVEHDKF